MIYILAFFMKNLGDKKKYLSNHDIKTQEQPVVRASPLGKSHFKRLRESNVMKIATQQDGQRHNFFATTLIFESFSPNQEQVLNVHRYTNRFHFNFLQILSMF